MMPSWKQFLMLFCLILLPHRAAPSTFESTTINVASTPRGQPSSSSAQRNCTTSKLKIVHLNIRSLRSPSHLIELRDWAAANKTDVITISEIWLNTSVTNCEVSIDGYKLYRQDRLRKRGRGVCAYIRKDVTVTVLKDISICTKRSRDQCFLLTMSWNLADAKKCQST